MEKGACARFTFAFFAKGFGGVCKAFWPPRRKRLSALGLSLITGFRFFSRVYPMNKSGLEKVADRMRRMRSAAELLGNAKDSRTAAAAWEDFLIAAGGFYSILERAARTTPAEIGWYGRIKHVRKNDPLLRYIHHARNAEEHGCQPISLPASTSGTLLTPGSSVWFTAKDGHWIASDVRGNVHFSKDAIRLVTVHDERFKDSFDPPCKHLGIPIEDTSAANIAELAITYLENVFSEASAMAITTNRST